MCLAARRASGCRMPGGSTSTLLTLLLAFVRSFADDQPAGRNQCAFRLRSARDLDMQLCGECAYTTTATDEDC